jgi:rod shape determining protein RodA
MSLPTTNRVMSANIRMFNWGNLRQTDWLLLLIITCLAGIGVLTLYSANRSLADSAPYYMKQLTFFPIGVMLALTIMCIDYRYLVSLAPVFYAILLVLLVLVLLFGDEAKGAQRWLVLGPIRFQPSEQSKLALIFMLAWYLSTIGQKIEKLPYFLLTFVITAVPAVLIFKQPNLGTAATMGPITIAMLYVAGCRRIHLFGLFALGGAALPILWSIMKPYQRSRVMTILDPSSDALGSGYHTIQSMITVGSGGLSGKGYREGTQTYLSYLPEHHTDFIFSLLAEEWGFIGSAVVVLLFLLLFIRSMMAARTSQDMAGSLLVVGIVTLLAFHVFVNIAITLGIAPVTGIPLPFLSYGRSFYLTTMLAMGVVLSVNTRKSFFE